MLQTVRMRQMPSGTTLSKAQRSTFVCKRTIVQIKHYRTETLRAQAGGDDVSLDNLPQPDDARGAIALGLKLTDNKQWEAAQVYFEQALTLPGTGLKRFRDKPRMLSDGEKIAALYNIACCQSQLGEAENIQNGLVAIAGCLESGYENFQQLRTDPDLENLRKSEKFEGLLARFEPKRSGGFMGLFKSL